MNEIILTSGYLGSGKTSFIRNFIESYGGTVALLINDFGKVNIDAIELENKSASMVELSNGSIFCSCLKDSFIQSLAELLAYERDLIIIEGSGLADPSNMGDVLRILKSMTERPFHYLGSVCLLDGQYFLKEVQIMESVVRQVEHSHMALVNKTDLIDEETKQAVRSRAIGLNPNIGILETAYGRCDAGELIGELRHRGSAFPAKPSLNTPENRPMTLLVNIEGIIAVEELREQLERILPHTNRMKGYVRIGGETYKAESVQESLDIRQSDRTGENEGVIVFLKNGLSSLRSIQKLGLKNMEVKT